MNPFENKTTSYIISSMERAPDFGYDDKASELKRRGINWKWISNNKVEVLK